MILGPSLLGPALSRSDLDDADAADDRRPLGDGAGRARPPDAPDRPRVSVRPPAPGRARVDRSSRSPASWCPSRRATRWRAGSTASRPSPAPELAFRLFFATAVSITAIPIMGRILIHTRLTRTRMGLTSITAAAIDDVLGWILLGAVVSMVTHGRADLRHARALVRRRHRPRRSRSGRSAASASRGCAFRARRAGGLTPGIARRRARRSSSRRRRRPTRSASSRSSADSSAASPARSTATSPRGSGPRSATSSRSCSCRSSSSSRGCAPTSARSARIARLWLALAARDRSSPAPRSSARRRWPRARPGCRGRSRSRSAC